MRISMNSLRWLSTAVFIAVAVSSEAAERSASYLGALHSIRADQLQGYVDYLADDTLKGREAGEDGGHEAGDYLAARCEELGLEPAGTDGSFFQPFGKGYRNVLGLIRGRDPERADEFILVGAHYDHVGYGTRANSRGGVGQIHNGADDNASGTAGVLELIEAFSFLPEPPARTIVFVFWDAEEKGLLGSRFWVREPTVPIEKVVAAINLDMIGRLREEKLLVYGTRTGYGLRRLVSRGNDQTGMVLDFPWDMIANADHYTFFQRGVPVLFFNTGTTDEYHTPQDDADTLNSRGMSRVSQLTFAAIYDLAEQPHVTRFRELGRHERPGTQRTRASQVVVPTPRLGIRWISDVDEAGGLTISQVTPGSPADMAGLEAGDRIVQFNGRPITTSDELSYAVMSAPSSTTARIERVDEAEPQTIEIELNGNPVRLGITWRTDDADQGVLILTHVVPGSPAAQAGLQRGDRVYQIGGQDFAHEGAFRQLARELPTPLVLRVEREGKIREARLQVPESFDREV